MKRREFLKRTAAFGALTLVPKPVKPVIADNELLYIGTNTGVRVDHDKFLELRRASREELMRIFNVPRVLVKPI